MLGSFFSARRPAADGDSEKVRLFKEQGFSTCCFMAGAGSLFCTLLGLPSPSVYHRGLFRVSSIGFFTFTVFGYSYGPHSKDSGKNLSLRLALIFSSWGSGLVAYTWPGAVAPLILLTIATTVFQIVCVYFQLNGSGMAAHACITMFSFGFGAACGGASDAPDMPSDAEQHDRRLKADDGSSDEDAWILQLIIAAICVILGTAFLASGRLVYQWRRRAAVTATDLTGGSPVVPSLPPDGRALPHPPPADPPAPEDAAAHVEQIQRGGPECPDDPSLPGSVPSTTASSASSGSKGRMKAGPHHSEDETRSGDQVPSSPGQSEDAANPAVDERSASPDHTDEARSDAGSATSRNTPVYTNLKLAFDHVLGADILRAMWQSRVSTRNSTLANCDEVPDPEVHVLAQRTQVRFNEDGAIRLVAAGSVLERVPTPRSDAGDSFATGGET